MARSFPVEAYTSASTVSYSVVFNEPVSNVQVSDFQETTGPDLQVSGPVTVSGSGANYSVTVNAVHGSGDLRLDLIDNDTIIDSTATPLGGVGLYNASFQGQTYTITQALPKILSINTVGSASTSSSSVDFSVTFNEPMGSVNPTDFQLISTGTVTGTISTVTAQSSTVYKVHVAGIAGLGSLSLGVAKGNQIRDLHGNPLLPIASTAPTSAFSLGLGYGVGLYPVSIDVADLTNNGIPDIVVANSSAYSVSVLLGKGDDIFPTQETLSLGYGDNPVSIAVADVNGDGIPDIIVANYYGGPSNTVSIFLGNGDGTFQITPLTLNVGATAASVVAGDFNGDGKTDLAIAFTQQNAIDVLLGNGDGTFQPPTQIPCGPAPYLLETADLANRGVLDLVASNFLGDSIGALMGKGDGTFAAEQVYPVGFGPGSLAIADLTGNGIADIVVSSDIATSSPGVSVLMGNGDGTFKVAQGYATNSAGPLAVADLNGDGIPDIVVAETTSSNSVQWLYGNGDGTFGTPFQLSGLTGNPSSIALADFNGDGIPDIVVAEVYNDLTLFTGNESTIAAATFRIVPQLVLSPVPASVVAGSTVSVQVQFEDPAGNPVTFADPVALYISGNPASPLASVRREIGLAPVIPGFFSESSSEDFRYEFYNRARI